jgi:hypothetical protein
LLPPHPAAQKLSSEKDAIKTAEPPLVPIRFSFGSVDGTVVTRQAGVSARALRHECAASPKGHASFTCSVARRYTLRAVSPDAHGVETSKTVAIAHRGGSCMHISRSLGRLYAVFALMPHDLVCH